MIIVYDINIVYNSNVRATVFTHWSVSIVLPYLVGCVGCELWTELKQCRPHHYYFISTSVTTTCTSPSTSNRVIFVIDGW